MILRSLLSLAIDLAKWKLTLGALRKLTKRIPKAKVKLRILLVSLKYVLYQVTQVTQGITQGIDRRLFLANEERMTFDDSQVDADWLELVASPPGKEESPPPGFDTPEPILWILEVHLHIIIGSMGTALDTWWVFGWLVYWLSNSSPPRWADGTPYQRLETGMIVIKAVIMVTC